jgi:hypothetical protein
MTPTDKGLIIIPGKNGVGTSALIVPIEDAIKGGAGDSKPVRRGEEKSRNTLELGDKPPAEFTVTRTRTANGNMTLLVKDKDGNKQESPQALLDKLYGALSFDPLHFVSQKPQERAETLRTLLGLAFKTEDAEIDKLFNERTIVNREVKAIEARAKVLTEYPDMPAEEQSAAAILDEQGKAMKINADNNVKRREVRNQTDGLAIVEEKVKTWQATVKRLYEELKGAQLGLAEAEAEVARKKEVVATKVKESEALKDIDTTVFVGQLREIEATNAKVRSNKAKAELRTQYKAKSKNADELSTKIEGLEKQKRKRIAEAKFPVDGLSLSDTTKEVLFNGIPFDQASTAEQLKVSVAMGLAMNPRLRVLLIRQGNDLDSDNLKLLGEMAEKADAQVWCERVETGGATVIIEDGHIQPSHKRQSSRRRHRERLVSRATGPARSS